jgi:hypothetical protein
LAQVWINDFRDLEQVFSDAAGSDDKIQANLQERASTDKGHARIVNGLLFGCICDRSGAPDFHREGWCCRKMDGGEEGEGGGDEGGAKKRGEREGVREEKRKNVCVCVCLFVCLFVCLCV